MAEIYLFIDGDRQGPLSVSDAKEWAQSKRFGPDDLVWIAARNEWVKARNVAQFKRIFSSLGLLEDETQEKTPPEGESGGLLVSISGEQYGPYPASTIIEYIKEGRVSRSDYVWIERHQKWFGMEKIVQFRRAFEELGGEEAPAEEPVAAQSEETPKPTTEVVAVEATPATSEPAITDPNAPQADSDWASFQMDDASAGQTGTQPLVSDADIVSRAFSDKPGEAGSAIGSIGDFMAGEGSAPARTEAAYVDPADLPLLKASAAKRFGGLIWDFVICFLFVAILGIVFYALGTAFKGVSTFQVFTTDPADTVGILKGAGFLASLSATFVYIALGVIGFYLLFRDIIFGNRSLGKRMAGLRVVNRYTKKTAGVGARLLRNLTIVTIAPIIIEMILVLVSSKGLRMGDHMSKTQVVDNY